MSWQEEDFYQEKIDFKIWWRIIALLKKQRREVFWLWFYMVLIAGCDTLFPYLNKVALDNFVNTQEFANQDLLTLVLVYGVFIGLQTICIYQFFLWAARIELGFSKDVRQQGFARLQELSFSYFDRTANGWIMARMGHDVARLAEILSWGLMDLIWGLAVMLFVSLVMLLVNWKMALLVLVAVPIMAYLSVWFQIKIHRQYQETRKINSLITAAYSEGITGAKTSKTLVLEEQNISDFQKLTSSMRVKSIRAAWYAALFAPLVLALSAFSTAAILWYGGNQAMLQTLEIGTVLLFTSYATQFFQPLREIAHLITDLQMAQTSAERVLSLINQKTDIVDSPEVVTKYGTIWQPKYENYEELVGDVEYRNVSFHYNKNEPVLKDFNLKVKAGETIALVGETGGGKSTIVNLLCRFYEPGKGQILIDGIDYRQRSIGWLHSNLGYVLQAPHLFDESILENVRFGEKSISEEQVIACCKLVHAHEFISEFEEAYNTRVGEGGNRLSSGQKQLISFARALCANPRILILDEATSSVDSANEELIQAAIASLLKNRTCFVVAHRLSTITKADNILVIKNGVISEQGKFKELIKKQGEFYKLYSHQQYIDQEKILLNKE